MFSLEFFYWDVGPTSQNSYLIIKIIYKFKQTQWVIRWYYSKLYRQTNFTFRPEKCLVGNRWPDNSYPLSSLVTSTLLPFNSIISILNIK